MPLAISTRANSGVGVAVTTRQIAAFAVSASSPLLVCIVQIGSETVSSLVWNGSENFTLIKRKISGAGSRTVDLYGLKNPTTATDDIDLTLGAATDVVMYAIATTGGDTATGWRAAFERNDGDGTGPGLTVTNAVSGDYVFHAALVLDAAIAFDGSEDTTSTEHDNIAGSTFSGGLSTLFASGSTAVGCADVAFYAEVAAAVIPAVAVTPPFVTVIDVRCLDPGE